MDQLHFHRRGRGEARHHHGPDGAGANRGRGQRRAVLPVHSRAIDGSHRRPGIGRAHHAREPRGGGDRRAAADRRQVQRGVPGGRQGLSAGRAPRRHAGDEALSRRRSDVAERRQAAARVPAQRGPAPRRDQAADRVDRDPDGHHGAQAGGRAAAYPRGGAQSPGEEHSGGRAGHLGADRADFALADELQHDLRRPGAGARRRARHPDANAVERHRPQRAPAECAVALFRRLAGPPHQTLGAPCAAAGAHRRALVDGDARARDECVEIRRAVVPARQRARRLERGAQRHDAGRRVLGREGRPEPAGGQVRRLWHDAHPARRRARSRRHGRTGFCFERPQEPAQVSFDGARRTQRPYRRRAEFLTVPRPALHGPAGTAQRAPEALEVGDRQLRRPRCRVVMPVHAAGVGASACGSGLPMHMGRGCTARFSPCPIAAEGAHGRPIRHRGWRWCGIEGCKVALRIHDLAADHGQIRRCVGDL